MSAHYQQHSTKMKNIAIFASGSGTNAINIINFFNYNRKYDGSPSGESQTACVKVVICNNKNAYVLTRAANASVEISVYDKEELTGSPSRLLQQLAMLQIDYIILAGYLLKVPDALIEKYRDRIINIHPALLPKYGGKGMYGHHVHEAVIAANEKESGITIHLVDEKYDNGRILFQARCTIEPGDGPQELASKIHVLEQMHFPNVIASFIKSCDNSRHPL